MSNREPIEPPGGFTPKDRPDDLSAPELKPDWLVGADDGVDFQPPPGPGPQRPTLSRPDAPRGAPSAPAPLRLAASPSPPQQPSAAESFEPAAEAWAPAASSIPKLTVVPKRERPSREVAAEEDLESVARLGEDGETETAETESADPAMPTAPEEPWWLVAAETLAANRPLQVGLAVLAAALLLWTYWPRKENQTIAIAAIKRHPQRFEGQAVRIRGEVGEVFDVGSGVVFELHQRRDTLVVFSPRRHPMPHDRVMIQGTVSTGYLDGTPRVALFEAPGGVPR